VEEMLEAGVAHVRGTGAAPLEERVRGDGRPVREPREPRAPTAADGGRVFWPGAGSLAVGASSHHRSRGREHRLLLPGPGRHLGRPDPSLLDEYGVGEGAADVDVLVLHFRTL